MRALAKTAFCFGTVLSALAVGASPADAQIFGRRVVVTEPTYVVPGQVVSTPVQATYVAPAGVTTYAPSGVVPAGYTATTMTTTAPVAVAPVRSYYAAYAAPRVVVGPLGRVRTVYPRRAYTYYPYPAY